MKISPFLWFDHQAEDAARFYTAILKTRKSSLSQCGWLKDKFGLSWQVVPKVLPELLNNPDSEKSERASL